MSLTLIIIILTVGISYYGFNNPSFLNKLVLNPVKVTRQKEYYRFVTSGFVHADFGHLIFNMLALWFFGEGMESFMAFSFGPQGKLYFLALYILGIIVSDIPSYLKNKNNSYYSSLGASGGVSALLFAFILLAPTNNICLYFFICIPGFIFGVIYMAYSFWEGRRGVSYVNHDAHLYGALFGMVFMALLLPQAVPSFFQQILAWTPF